MQPLAIGTSATDAPDDPATAPTVAEGPLGPRARRAAMAALAVLAACLVVGSGLPDRLRGVVDARPEYAWSLDAIALDPPPPDWLRDGRAVLLDGARPALERFEGGSALDDDLLPAIERAFKNLRWVERVERVRQAYPNKVTVRAPLPTAGGRPPVRGLRRRRLRRVLHRRPRRDPGDQHGHGQRRPGHLRPPLRAA